MYYKSLEGNYSYEDDETPLIVYVSPNGEISSSWMTCKNPPHKFVKPMEYEITDDKMLEYLIAMSRTFFFKEKASKIVHFNARLSDILEGLIKFNCSMITVGEDDYSTTYILSCVILNFLRLPTGFYDGLLMSGYQYLCRTLVLTILKESYYDDIDALVEILHSNDLDDIVKIAKIANETMTKSSNKFIVNPEKSYINKNIKPLFDILQDKYVESLMHTKIFYGPSRCVNFQYMHIANCMLDDDALVLQSIIDEISIKSCEVFNINPRDVDCNGDVVPVSSGQIKLFELMNCAFVIKKEFDDNEAYFDDSYIALQFYRRAARIKRLVSLKSYCDADVECFKVCFKLCRRNVLRYKGQSKFEVINKDAYDIVYEESKSKRSVSYRRVVTHDDKSVVSRIIGNDASINMDLVDCDSKEFLSKIGEACFICKSTKMVPDFIRDAALKLVLTT